MFKKKLRYIFIIYNFDQILSILFIGKQENQESINECYDQKVKYQLIGSQPQRGSDKKSNLVKSGQER